ncbi:MAG: DUF4258 domain-containing protein [Sulfuricella sp.]|nr:DUF4258 domain-containing protein [Sulfuricella sp.]
MNCSRVVFSGHALKRMFERTIGKNEIVSVLTNGEIIQEYPNDQPYPSNLIIGFGESGPLHVPAAQDEQNICYVVTCYRPDSALWQDDFKKRRTT